MKTFQGRVVVPGTVSAEALVRIIDDVADCFRAGGIRK